MRLRGAVDSAYGSDGEGGVAGVEDGEEIRSTATPAAIAPLGWRWRMLPRMPLMSAVSSVSLPSLFACLSPGGGCRQDCPPTLKLAVTFVSRPLLG